ncbi:MAG: hypothetical protein COU07_03550 [Candidatus Harrisonbacteria bacterium CG10_big_fil_rev_8_21_14_0_10_40_38]|uniref:Tyrosine recombinase XerC n=1 Tax=Candidatus Harrisonbacteria bacterium CG10_big_fil_rev_8_21_14_0_10_40_38 TaxID=1974583 RepID=A0A2H0UT24_9BACT|nr:MAG: hypothetical protein COU07_03550 [Candidatus Harrisonbacteria bacterium CG10_big_fil_rev_8_21_14_0_10_40_38]
MTEAEKSLKEYLDYLEIEKNRSLRTRDNYDRYIKRFFKEENISKPSDITVDTIRNFRLKLARSKTEEGIELKKSTQSYYAIAIRNFLRYLIKKGHTPAAPDEVELPKLPDREIEMLDARDLERILNSPEGKNLRSLRDRAILETLFSTGLRLSELCSLGRYIDLDRGEVSVRGKGSKIRVVFLSDGAKESIKEYLKKRVDTEEALFISISKQGSVMGKISPRSVERLVTKYARKAGVGSRVTPHSFRHLFATDLLVNGADLRSVQELLGHSHISTTQVYTHLTNKELKDIHRAFHARRRDKK